MCFLSLFHITLKNKLTFRKLTFVGDGVFDDLSGILLLFFLFGLNVQVKIIPKQP